MQRCLQCISQKFIKWTHLSGSLFAALIGAMLITGCAAPIAKTSDPTTEAPPRRLAIFFDGTANDESSNTNIFKLYELVTDKVEKSRLGTFYIEGVGANAKVIGMGTGWGIGYRVKLAYKYLANTYRKGDQIYLFGFSRGAYSARILASMLYHVGLPESPNRSTLGDDDVAAIFDAFKGDLTREERKLAAKRAVAAIDGLPPFKPVDITFMGLWDTVEALGVPDYQENVVLPNKRYGDQLCNVKRAAHALALDDDRARIFTPILLSRPHLLEHCTVGEENAPWSLSPEGVKDRLNQVVDEVWFTGAHADVGGGYKNKDTGLGAISLNWMVEKLIDDGLLPAETKKFEGNPDGDVHNPEAGLWGAIYRQKWRSFIEYAGSSPYNNGKLKIHTSVINRLKRPEKLSDCASNPPADHGTNCQPRSSQWRLPELFPYCFPINQTGGYDFTQTAAGCLLDEVPSSNPETSRARGQTN